MLALNNDQDFYWGNDRDESYTMEIVDLYGKFSTVYFGADEYEDAYSYCQYNSKFSTVDCVYLSGQSLKEPLVFEKGFRVKG